MLRWLRPLLRWLIPWKPRHEAETSRIIIGSTGSGKSEGELVDLVALAERGEYAVVLLDGHGPLAFRAAGHWAARGHENRLVYEPLHTTDRVLCWNMLPKSAFPTLSQRRLDDAETRDEVAQCFMAHRKLDSLNDRAWTKEWLEAAIGLCLAQPTPEPLTSLLRAFRMGSAEYERLIGACELPALIEKFRGLERLRRKSEVQYELQTGPARRFLELVCTSEVVRLRSRPGPFDWLQAMREKRLIAFDGGGIRSRELKRSLFLLVTMQVIHAIRRHFAETQQQPLPVVLVLEEAGALGLVSPFVPMAMQELRKAGLAVHIITQSSLDFGDRDLFESLLAHTPWQAWYQVLAPADQELGGKALANATFDPHAVFFTRTRHVPNGVMPIATESRGEAVDPRTGIHRQDRRVGTAFLARHRAVEEEYFKTPGLHEQEYRTQLATLRIGERLVRDRIGVRRERVTPLQSPRLPLSFDAFTRAVIERIRRQPIYQPCPPENPAAAVKPLPNAAARLRSIAETQQSLTLTDGRPRQGRPQT